MLEVDISVPRREFDVVVALTVADGERLALFGPSGSGKTTVLEAIAGLVVPSRGRIVLAGRELSAHGDRRRRTGIAVWQRGVGLLRQDPCLFAHLSVEANVTYAGLAWEDPQVARLVGLLKIGGLRDAWPRALSGGQAQRVALARALLGRQRALLLDEPYSGLDSALRRELSAVVRDEVRVRRVPAILVAHELGDAQAFADRLGVLDRGRLLQVGAPDDVVRHPASRRVAELVGYQGFVPVDAVDGDREGGCLTAGVHPDRVRLGAFGALGKVFSGRVTARRPAGAGWELDVEVPSVPSVNLSCRFADDNAPRPGEVVVLTALDPPLFAADGTAVLPSVTAAPATTASTFTAPPRQVAR